MSTIKRYLLKPNKIGKSEIILRLSVNANVKHRLKSGLFIDPKFFDVSSGAIKRPRINNTIILELTKLEKQLNEIENRLILHSTTHPLATKQELQQLIFGNDVITDFTDFTDITTTQNQTFDIWQLYDEFIATYKGTQKFNHISAKIAFYRYCNFISLLKRLRIKYVTDITTDLLKGFAPYLESEKTLLKRYPKIASKITYKGYNINLITDKSNNTIRQYQTALTTFFNWLVKNDVITKSPLEKVEKVAQNFATPFYLTIDERNLIADKDLSKFPTSLQVARDVFIFHCFVGCRYSDLKRLTADNIKGNFLEYIPIKTRHKRANVVRVPLHPKAIEIVSKYANKHRLLPVKSFPIYNDQIRKILTICGITRNVITLDTKGNEINVPINEAATTHTARKTFIGNLYKKVADPNLIASMSGHTENSTAFARYRVIDDEMKENLISMLD